MYTYTSTFSRPEKFETPLFYSNATNASRPWPLKVLTLTTPQSIFINMHMYQKQYKSSKFIIRVFLVQHYYKMSNRNKISFIPNKKMKEMNRKEHVNIGVFFKCNIYAQSLLLSWISCQRLVYRGMTCWHTILLGMFYQQQQEKHEKSMPKMYTLFITDHVFFLSNASFLCKELK